MALPGGGELNWREDKDVQDCWSSEAHVKRNTNMISVYHGANKRKTTMMLVKNYGADNEILYWSLIWLGKQPNKSKHDHAWWWHVVRVTEKIKRNLLKSRVRENSKCTEDRCRTWTLTAAHHILPKCGILLNQVHGQNIERGKKTQARKEAVRLNERSRFNNRHSYI